MTQETHSKSKLSKFTSPLIMAPLTLALACLFVWLSEFDIGSSIFMVVVVLFTSLIPAFLVIKLIPTAVPRNISTTFMALSMALILAFGTEKAEPYQSSRSGSGSSHKCSQCGSSYTHNGWSTAGGEQFMRSSDPGYDEYCSKQCAYNSQPAKWKR